MDPDWDYLNGGGKPAEACVISLSFGVTGAQTQWKNTGGFCVKLNIFKETVYNLKGI